MSEKNKTGKKRAAIAREQDGNIQITLSISYAEVEKAKKEALEKIAKDIEIPGFRKGNAPISQVEKKVSDAKLIEDALGEILPKAFSEAVEEFKIKPVIYPRFELIKAKENEDWQVRATTCELPEVKLGDYKKLVSSEAKAKEIWTPEKGSPDKEGAGEKTREEKEQILIMLLLKNYKLNIPKILIDQEVDNKLAQLLERIEKLGLTLEGYLNSIGKNPEILRKEHEEQARQNITLDLVLQKIAEEEKIEASQKEIDDLIKSSAADLKLQEKLNTPEQRRFIASILKKRKTLESLLALL